MTYIHQLIEDRVIVTKTISTKKQEKKGYGEFIKYCFFLLDYLCLNAICLAIIAISGIVVSNYYFLIFFNFSWLFLNLFFERNRLGRNTDFRKIVFGDLKIVFIHFLLITSFSQFFLIGENYFIELIFWYLIFLPILTLVRSLVFYLLIEYRKQGFNFRKIAIVGGGSLGKNFHSFIENNPRLGYKFCGIFDDKENFNDFFHYCRYNKIDDIFCTLSSNKSAEIYKIMEFADNNLIRFRLIPDFKILFNLNRKIDISFYDGIPVLTPRHEPLEKVHNRILKRAFDIVFSFLIISVLIFFLLPIIAILIKITSKGPVFFKQLRTGKDNKEFYCYKFRTMAVNNESDKIQASTNDFRITKIGRFLRKSNLDELPQFFNVLKGEMSVVGPRPHMLLHTEEYSKKISKYMLRHLIKPGITGWAQINGYRGNTEDSELMRKRIEYDTWYLENWSIWLDIKIIFSTTFKVFFWDKNAF